jgi:flagellar protein FlbD
MATGGTGMIALRHFGNGNRIALNVDLIEKVEETPDTVITLTNGAHYLVQESLDEIIDKSIEVKARALQLAQHVLAPKEGQRLRLLRPDDPEAETPAGSSADPSSPSP